MSTDAPVKVVVGMPFASLMGGAERYLDLVARRAHDHGLDLHVVFLAEGSMVDDLARAGVRTSAVPLGRNRETSLRTRHA